jgi:FkbM family methyltransferase
MKITNEGWAIVERDTHIGRWVQEHKRLDFDQNALPQMLPYIKPGGIVLDIGANIGCYAYAFGQIAHEVYCFEPNLEAFECLKINLSLSWHPSEKLNLKYVLFNLAVSDKKGKCNIICESENIGMSHIAEGTEIPVVTIDNEDGSPKLAVDFIKIDVEGYEMHVLRGGEQTINKFKPVMVIEINDHTLKRTGVNRNEIFQWLTDHGYTFRNIYAEQGLEDEQLDIICFPS